MYTVKQLSDLAGVSIRTLHYYDEIGLLKPSSVGDNGYRYYDEAALFRLQQILFFREMELGLLQIKEIMDSPGFNLMAALQSHREVLQDKIHRLQRLIQTVDSTILHLAGEVNISQQQLFNGFDEEKQRRYEQEAIQKYGERSVRESVQRWNSYTPQQKEQIKAEGGAIYSGLVKVMEKGAAHPDVQALIARWHQHIRYFYEPTPEVLRCLGRLYNESPDFQTTFRQFHPDLPALLEAAIAHYCNALS